MVGAEAEEEAQALRQAAADQAAGLPGIVNNVQIAEKGSKRYLFISGILLHWQPRPPQDLLLPRPLWGLHRQPPGLGLGYVLVCRIVSMSAGPTNQTDAVNLSLFPVSKPFINPRGDEAPVFPSLIHRCVIWENQSSGDDGN